MVTDGYYNRRPWDSLSEARLTATLGAMAGASAAEIQALRPPLPRTQLFPARFGFEKRTLTVQDCFGMTNRYDTARDDETRMGPGYTGSQVTSLGQG